MGTLVFVIFAVVAAGHSHPTAFNRCHQSQLREQSFDFHPKILVFRRPLLLLVDSNDGLLTTYTQRGLSLITEDPTANVVCREIVKAHDQIAILITPNKLPLLKTKAIIKGLSSHHINRLLSRVPVETSIQSPWLIVSRRERLLIDPSVLDQIFLRVQHHGLEPWDLQAYTFPGASATLSETALTEEFSPAPAPLFAALCVSPDKPRPFPVLFAPPSSPLAAFRPQKPVLEVPELAPTVSITVPTSQQGLTAIISVNSLPAPPSQAGNASTSLPESTTSSSTESPISSSGSFAPTTTQSSFPSPSESFATSTPSSSASLTSSESSVVNTVFGATPPPAVQTPLSLTSFNSHRQPAPNLTPSSNNPSLLSIESSSTGVHSPLGSFVSSSVPVPSPAASIASSSAGEHLSSGSFVSPSVPVPSPFANIASSSTGEHSPTGSFLSSSVPVPSPSASVSQPVSSIYSHQSEVTLPSPPFVDSAGSGLFGVNIHQPFHISSRPSLPLFVSKSGESGSKHSSSALETSSGGIPFGTNIYQQIKPSSGGSLPLFLITSENSNSKQTNNAIPSASSSSTPSLLPAANQGFTTSSALQPLHTPQVASLFSSGGDLQLSNDPNILPHTVPLHNLLSPSSSSSHEQITSNRFSSNGRPHFPPQDTSYFVQVPSTLSTLLSLGNSKYPETGTISGINLSHLNLPIQSANTASFLPLFGTNSATSNSESSPSSTSTSTGSSTSTSTGTSSSTSTGTSTSTFTGTSTDALSKSQSSSPTLKNGNQVSFPIGGKSPDHISSPSKLLSLASKNSNFKESGSHSSSLYTSIDTKRVETEAPSSPATSTSASAATSTEITPSGSGSLTRGATQPTSLL